MPKAKYDWATAKALYFKGGSLDQVAKKLGIPQGTMAAYAVRHAWCLERGEVREVTHAALMQAKARVHATSMQVCKREVKEVVKAWLGSSLKTLEKHAAGFEKHEPDTIEGLQLACNAFGKHVDTGFKLLGLDKSAGDPTAAMKSAHGLIESEAIEVSEVPRVQEDVVTTDTTTNSGPGTSPSLDPVQPDSDKL